MDSEISPKSKQSPLSKVKNFELYFKSLPFISHMIGIQRLNENGIDLILQVIHTRLTT